MIRVIVITGPDHHRTSRLAHGWPTALGMVPEGSSRVWVHPTAFVGVDAIMVVEIE